jgi:hypothetical protein
MRHEQRLDDARKTKKIFQAHLKQKQPTEDPRLDGKMMWRMTYKRRELLTGDKRLRIWPDVGQHLGRLLPFLGSGGGGGEEI